MKRCANYLLIILALAFAGCTTVQFSKQEPDGSIVTVSYSRLFSDVTNVKGQVGDNTISVGGSTVNVESLTELLKAIPK